MTLQHITVKQVQEACRKAYDEKRLAAQDMENNLYYYQHGDFGCAIGVALSPESAALIPDQAIVLESSDHHYNSSFENAFSWLDEELTKLADIQKKHDFWRNAAHREHEGVRELEGTSADGYKNDFLKVINHPDAKD